MVTRINLKCGCAADRRTRRLYLCPVGLDLYKHASSIYTPLKKQSGLAGVIGVQAENALVAHIKADGEGKGVAFIFAMDNLQHIYSVKGPRHG